MNIVTIYISQNIKIYFEAFYNEKVFMEVSEHHMKISDYIINLPPLMLKIVFLRIY